MNYLSVEGLSKSFGPKVLFENISFGISKGEKVALVAKNGYGKSTLLKILAGEEAEDKGVVAFRNGVKVGFLKQEPKFGEDLTVFEAVFTGDGEVLQAVKFYEEAMLNPDDTDAMQKAFSKMDDMNAWDYEAKVKQILGYLNIENLSQQVSDMSGGQQKRLALAQVLIEEPDFLILDEPTNHLDVDVIEWLQDYLEKTNMTLLMVTHDRYFLEEVCDVIWELDEGKMHRYPGNYSAYLTSREERKLLAEKEVQKAKNIFSRELEWMRRQPKARGTKAKYRVDAFHELKKTAKKNTKEDELLLEVKSERLGKKIIEVDGLTKSYDGKSLLDDFSYIFKRKEKIGVVGSNGVGKSTFLNLLVGKIEPDAGTIDKGETIKIGYYNQQGLQLPPDKRVIDVVKDKAEFIEMGDGTKLSAGKMLERFMFPSDQQYAMVSTLSGGEKRRLHLLTILMENPNFLILDEPTNDLDIFALQVLEDFLEQYGGCLMIVSHDRFFMDKLVDHIFVFEGQGIIKDFNGKYTELREIQKAQKSTTKETKVKPVEENPVEASAQEKSKQKLSYKEKEELKQLDAAIPQLESRLKEIEGAMGTTQDTEEITKLSGEYEQLKAELEEKEERWLELSEFI